MAQDFYHYYRVESLARTVPSRHKPDKGTDRYVHIIAFNDAEDHELTIRNHLQYSRLARVSAGTRASATSWCLIF